MQQHLGIGVRPEPVAARLQARPQLHVVKDLAVEDDPERSILVAERLLAVAQIQDGKPCTAQPDTLIKQDAELIRPAVPDQGQHLTQREFGDL